MIVLTVFLIIYLTIGFIYAFYIAVKGADPWYAFLINTLLGPFHLLYVWHAIKSKKRTAFNQPTRKQVRILEGKRAVFFDLDGTLADTTTVWQTAVENVLDTIDIGIFRATSFLQAGEDISTTWKRILNASVVGEKPTVQEVVDKTHEELVKLLPSAELQLTEGFWELLTELKVDKKLKVALVTNTTEKITQELTKKLEVDGVFDSVVTSDQVKNKKPAPDVYKKAAKELGVKTREVLVFEDSVLGARAAAVAGTDIIIVWNRTRHQYEYPQRVYEFIPDFSCIVGFLDKSYNEIIRETAEGLRQKKQETPQISQQI